MVLMISQNKMINHTNRLICESSDVEKEIRCLILNQYFRAGKSKSKGVEMRNMHTKLRYGRGKGGKGR